MLPDMSDLYDAVGEMRAELRVPALSARIAQGIEQLILEGRLKPGSRLPEEQVSRHLGISRASLREAIIGLESSGLVAREGRSARVIRRLDQQDVTELYEMWTILESEAASIACLDAVQPQRIEIERILDMMDQPVDRNGYHRLNLEFHRALVAPCRNRRLVDTYDACIKQVRWIWALAISAAGDPDISRVEHRTIATAYLARDPEKTRALIRAHLSAGGKRTAVAKMKRAGNRSPAHPEDTDPGRVRDAP